MTWMNFLTNLVLVLNWVEVAILTMSISRVWAPMMMRNTWNASFKVRKV